MPAGKLSIGEQVKTRQGLTRLTAKDKLAGTHRVYNLEVYRDHNYMVSMDSILVHNTKGRKFSVDPSLQQADIDKKALINGSYVKNPTAKPINDMINSQSGRVGNKQTNGQYMYVIDTKGNIIIGTRGKNSEGNNLKMPHPTLIGGKDPQVLGAGVVDIRAGKIHSVDLVSGHYKPSNDALGVVKTAFDKLPKGSFGKGFKGYTPYKE